MQGEGTAIFPGVSIGELEVLESIGGIMGAFGRGAGGGLGAAGGGVVVIGVCGGGVMFLVMLMNVVEFFGMFVLFNVRYSY